MRRRSLVGNRLYLFSRQGDDEVMSALDADTGKVIWRTAYPIAVELHPAATKHGPGPKSTPVFADGKLFALGFAGTVTAYDANTGKQLWQKPATQAATSSSTAMRSRRSSIAAWSSSTSAATCRAR